MLIHLSIIKTQLHQFSAHDKKGLSKKHNEGHKLIKELYAIISHFYWQLSRYSDGPSLQGQVTVVRYAAGARNFSLLHSVKTGSEGHRAPYPIGTRGSFLGDKAAEAWSWALTSTYCQGL
jgi:hypothetical protein